MFHFILNINVNLAWQLLATLAPKLKEREERGVKTNHTIQPEP